MRKLFYSGCVAALLVFAMSCGNSSAGSKKAATPEDAKTYFTDHVSDINSLISKSMPGKDDCKAVFKTSEDADIFLGMVKQMSKEGDMGIDGNFSEVQISTFTTSDLINETRNEAYTGGMLRIKDKLQPNITFYQVTLGNDGKRGTSLNYWVFVNGHWTFFVKPWRAFRGND